MLKSKLKVLMAIHDITQIELSEKTGIRRPTISNFINNKIKQIPVEAVIALCQYFNCGIGDLWEYIPENNTDPHGAD